METESSLVRQSDMAGDIHQACEAGDTEEVERLIRMGVDINKKNDGGLKEEAIARIAETNRWENFNITLLRNDLIYDKETRAKGSCVFFRYQLKRNGRNLTQTVCSIKNHLYPYIYHIVHEDCFPGITRVYCSSGEDFWMRIKKIKPQIKRLILKTA